MIEDKFLDELLIQRHTLVKHLAIALGLVSATIMWWASMQEPSVNLVELALWASALVVCLGVFALSDRYWLFSRYLLIAGMTLTFLVGMRFLSDIWFPFWGITIVFAVTMLIPVAGIGVTVIALAMAAYLVHIGVRDYPLESLLAAYSTSLVVSLVIANTLVTALKWYENTQVEMARLLKETRDRRAELKQTIKSLKLSYDIQNRMQQELVYSRQKAEAIQQVKERFVATISHELRTPLNIILGFSEMIHLSPEVYGDVNWQPTLRRDIYQIYRNSQHLLKMIDDILDLAHFEQTRFTLHREPTPLTFFFNDTMEIAQDIFANHPAQLTATIEDNLPVLEIDRARIRQVLLNLLENARCFTTEGTISLVAKREDNKVVVSLTDTGIGIPADKLPFIFDDFYQVNHSLSRNHGGVGLGLAICQRFIEAHKGHIWAESHEGVGSTFSFSLPMSNYRLSPDSLFRQPRQIQTSKTQPCILVIDTDPAVAATIDRQLENYAVVQVERGENLEEAIATYYPRLIIHNVIPGKQGTIHRDFDLPIPIIECSLPSQSWVTEQLAVTACLTKPISAEGLIREIKRLEGIHDILIIDDDRGFAQLVERILRTSSVSYRIRRAYQGMDGLAMMQEHPPDLVLLDLVMPETDGFELLQILRQDSRLAKIPIILLTASSYAEDYLARYGSQFLVLRSNGLHMVETMACMKAAISVLQSYHDGSPDDEYTNGRQVQVVAQQG